MSKQELRRKLLPYAENAEEVDALLEELSARNWQSDDRYAESYVYSKAKRYGRLRLTQALTQQGVDAEVIAAALPQQADEQQTACAVLRKKFDSPPKDLLAQQRAYRFLAYRGFSGEHIRYALQHAWDDEM